MPGIKIINVLKEDTLAEILEIFRQAPVGEVIFVLPRTGKLFRKEDHFSAFASEAANGGKTISILTSSAATATLARKYKFNVMSSGKGKGEPAAKPASPVAKLAASPPPADDVRDDDATAVDSDSRVVSTSDETQGTDATEEDDEKMEGFTVVDADGPVDTDGNVNPDEPAAKDGEDADADLTTATTEAAPRSAVSADLDYIDAVWRSKAGAGATAVAVAAVPRRAHKPESWKRYLRMPSFARGGSVLSSKRMVTGALALSVVLLGAAVYMTAGAATISINPTARPVDLQFTVQASDVFSTVDANFNKIPGQLFEVSKTATAEHDASGQRDVASKSRIRLTIHNEYSSTPQALVATTRFATPDGLVFRTLQSVTVPGSTVKEGKPVAGTVTVDAIADKPGPQYNVPAGKWTVVAFTERSDTDRAARIFGVSAESASGGANGPSKVITQGDYDTARAEAVASVKDQIAKAFGEQQSGLRILDEAEPVLGEVTSTARPDDAAPSVSVTAAGTLRTVAFRQPDLDTLLVDAVLARERLVVVPEQLELSFSDVAFKSDTGVLSFSVTLKGTGYAPLDAKAILEDIKGKNSQQIRDYFADKEGVDTAAISLRPFWVRQVPDKESRINVRVNYEVPEVTPETN